jgi:hypothetical protein
MTIHELRRGHKYKTADAEVFVHEAAARYVVIEYVDEASVQFRKSLGRSCRAKIYKSGHPESFELVK